MDNKSGAKLCLRVFIFYNRKVNFVPSFVFLKAYHDGAPTKKIQTFIWVKKRIIKKKKKMMVRLAVKSPRA